jgi:hypothetical protein
MDSERIKEIQQGTAYPDSVSVKQALLQVWNECEQDKNKYSEDDMKFAFTEGFNARYKMQDGVESRERFMKQIKKK